jgi:uncharacterized protein (DUF1501 family)
MKRRAFLQSSSVISLPLLVNGLQLGYLPKSGYFNFLDGESDKVLILIQLNGGNDGLNMIIPLDQYDNLAQVRSNILIPENQIIPVDDQIGMHPSMTGLSNLFHEEKISIVQSVGYPNQNRSHFRSTDIWMSGSAADKFLTTGWMGRYFDSKFPGYPEGYPDSENPDPFAITMGAIVSETCQGLSSNFSMTLQDPFTLGQIGTGEQGEIPDTNFGFELRFLLEAIAQTNAYAETVTNAANNGANLSTLYDENNNLAQQLKTAALLISGGLKTKLYVVSIGGFDTHANQVDQDTPLSGRHATLLQDLSSAIEAFQDDLNKLGLEERVLGMTFSEFGRQIRSNDSLGTDHGTAAPLILFGSCVNPDVIGDNPEIGEEVEPQEGVPMQYDFRSVYGSVLMDWFDATELEVQNLLFNEFQYIPVIKGCEPSTSTNSGNTEFGLDLLLSPNPANTSTNISFHSPGGRIRISVFDHLGHEILFIADKDFIQGDQLILLSTGDLPHGNYYVRLAGKSWQKTKKLIVI